MALGSPRIGNRIERSFGEFGTWRFGHLAFEALFDSHDFPSCHTLRSDIV